MHELSIAQSIVEIAEDYAQKEQASKVKELELSIGTMAGIEFDSLEFALSVCTKGTCLEEAHIQIEKVQARARCLDCDSDFDVVHLFDGCPICKGYRTMLLCGKELKVKSLLID